MYLLSGGGDRSDWVRNLMVSPDVVLEIGAAKRSTRVRVIDGPDEDVLARRLLVEKYGSRGDDLNEWGRTALPIAIDWAEPREGR